MGQTDGPTGSSTSAQLWLELGLVTALATVIRLVALGVPPFVDELNHVLAAKSFLQHGSLAIYDGGPYLRGRLFTYVVAGFMAVFGDGLAVARLPATISGVLLVCLLFAWLWVEGGRLAAWTTALLLAFAPISIYLSHWVRFYTMHALFFWLACFGVYRLITGNYSPLRRLMIGTATLLALLLAFHLQVTTVIGGAGLAAFGVLAGGAKWLSKLSRRERWVALGVAGLAVAAIVGIFYMSGVLRWLALAGSQVDAWAADRAHNPRFYHWMFTEEYGFLWTLFPVAVLFACARRWNLALLFVSVFGVAIIGHSIAAWKAERYVFYVLPAFFGVWGLAVAEVVPRIWRRLTDTTDVHLAVLPGWARRGVAGLALAAALGFAATGPAAYAATRTIYLQRSAWKPGPEHLGEVYSGLPDWEEAAPELKDVAEDVDVVVGEPDLKVIYYVGRIDYVLYAGHLVKKVRGDGSYEMYPEFSVWSKIGRPVVSEVGSMAGLMTCYESGLVVAEKQAWGWMGAVPRETAALIAERADALPLPDDTGLVAYTWHHLVPEPSDRCERIRRAPGAMPMSSVPAVGEE